MKKMIKKGILLSFLVMFSGGTLWAGGTTGDSDIPIDRPGEGGNHAGTSGDADLPRPGEGGNHAGTSGDADRDVPIDMYTTSLLITGTALMFGYAYYNRRKQPRNDNYINHIDKIV